MGKNRHSKDRLFLTATEWKRDYGGKNSGSSSSQGSRPLPFDHCALSLAPFENPVLIGKKTGVVFDLENVVPYLQKYNCDPVTGEEASTKDIIHLKMEKDADEEWCCPITSKVFTNSSHIVAIATSGRVYSYDAVNELNLKAKSFVDLVSGETFRRSDIITIQNPQDVEVMARRDVNNFVHLQQVRADNAAARNGESSVRPNARTERALKAIAEHQETEKATGVKRKSLDELLERKRQEEEGYMDDVLRFMAMSPTISDVNPGEVITDGRASSALTSTSAIRWQGNDARPASAEEIRSARYKIMRQMGKKGYVQLQTNLGNLNIEVHCNIVPRTSWNFLALCERGYYDEMKVHRLIPDFMVQAGDPTGTGCGGESAFNGEKFQDEFDTRIKHDTRGVLSMANSGFNTNGSQFFIIFKPTSHLDLKHAVFGRVVGGLNVLDRIEEVGCNKKEEPLSEVKIIKAVVFTNPIHEADEQLETFIRNNIEQRRSKSKPTALPSSSSDARKMPSAAAPSAPADASFTAPVKYRRIT